MSLTVGFCGLGQMGSRMAANVAVAGLPLRVWNRTRAKADDFARSQPASASVTVHDTPRSVAEESDVVVTMLADEHALWEVFEGADGLLSGMRPGTVAVEMSTTGPEAVQRLALLLEKVESSLLDAPVSGSVTTAEAGELTIMAGGPVDALKRAEPAMSAMGGRVFHLGPTGCGAAMKLAVNTVIMGLNQAVAEGLVLAEKAGIERTAAYRVFAASAIAAPFVHYRRAAFERPEEYPSAFAVTLGEKDLDLILELAEQTGTELPQSRANRVILREATEAGFGDDDISAVAQYLRRRSGDERVGPRGSTSN